MKNITILTILLSTTLSLFAQRPKMHLKAKIGSRTMTIVYKEAELSRDYFYGFHGGFGFRVIQKKKMAEIDFDFVRSYIDYSDSLDQFTIKLNSFEIPVTLGYVTIKKPVFKHFLYGGIATNFNIKSVVTSENFDEDIVFKPKQLFLTSPNFNMRFGTQLDIAMFNLDFNYSIGLNKAARENVRTQSHIVQLVLGLVF